MVVLVPARKKGVPGQVARHALVFAVTTSVAAGLAIP